MTRENFTRYWQPDVGGDAFQRDLAALLAADREQWAVLCEQEAAESSERAARYRGQGEWRAAAEEESEAVCACRLAALIRKG